VVFDRGRARVFDGSYQDFLDTVGWESDEDDLGSAPTKARASHKQVHVNPEPMPSAAQKPVARTTPQTPADRKAERQARAKLVQERAKLIGPLEKRVADLETLIVSLERERDLAFAALAEASAKGDAATIAKLSKKSSDVNPRIDWAYSELEKATKELELAAKAFDERTG
jgi:ATP-binding cassette subfamily F protein 3